MCILIYRWRSSFAAHAFNVILATRVGSYVFYRIVCIGKRLNLRIEKPVYNAGSNADPSPASSLFWSFHLA